MAPPLPTFHVSELPTKLNVLPSGKPRNPPIDLAECALKELVQYRCSAAKPKPGEKPVIVCEPVVRFYRQCAENLMVETTAWEDWRGRERERNG
ncbi:hypothetical protein K505DRAFT_192210, partial [Melanomma pulvis-pyrius CBS 109.77]